MQNSYEHMGRYFMVVQVSMNLKNRLIFVEVQDDFLNNLHVIL